MISGLVNSNVSSMQAHGTKLQSHGNNVANQQTDGFVKDSVTLSSDATGEGVVPVMSKEAPTESNAQEQSTEDARKDPSNVDLATEFIGMSQTSHGYSANLSAIEAADEMIGTTLETVA